jgi:hypothetical protein
MVEICRLVPVADDSIPGTSEEKKGFAFARAMTPRAWMESNP